MTSTTSQVSDISCSQACTVKMNWYKEQLEKMTRRAEDLSYERYEQSKIIKPLKAKLEATTKDFKRIAHENSNNKGRLIYANQDIAKLTAELEALKIKYQNNEFSIKKFDASRPAVEVLIDEQSKYRHQEKEKKGLGYNEVPPPWNDNYTSPFETKEYAEPMQYGKPTAAAVPTTEHKTENEPTQYGQSTVPVSVKTESSGPTANDKVNDSDASTSCADTVIVEDWVEEDNNYSAQKLNDTNVSSSCAGKQLVDDGHKQDDISSRTNDSIPASSSTCVVEPGSVAEPNASVISGSKSADSECVCSCSCGKPLKQNRPKTKSQNQPGTKSQAQSPNYPPLKRQTCFNCGIPGHIARNCPHRPYVPYYAQSWQNVPRGRSSKRNPSRSRSRDGNWNDAKAKRQKARDNKDRTQDSRDAFTKPHWVRSRSSQGSSYSSHLRYKPKAKGRPNSKSSAEAPIRSNHKFFKPNYRWVPKGSMSKTKKDPVNFSHSLSNQQDMSWESVTSIDSNGKPSVKMDWVPKTV